MLLGICFGGGAGVTLIFLIQCLQVLKDTKQLTIESLIMTLGMSAIVFAVASAIVGALLIVLLLLVLFIIAMVGIPPFGAFVMAAVVTYIWTKEMAND
jgi:hypothetical protein